MTTAPCSRWTSARCVEAQPLAEPEIHRHFKEFHREPGKKDRQCQDTGGQRNNRWPAMTKLGKDQDGEDGQEQVVCPQKRGPVFELVAAPILELRHGQESQA